MGRDWTARLRARVAGWSPIERWLAVALTAGAVLRVGVAVYGSRHVPLDISDQRSYYLHARDLVDGRGFVSFVNGKPSAYYPPGYPLVLAAVFFVVLHTPIPDDLMLVAALLNVAAQILTAWLVFVIGRRLATPFAGLAGAVAFLALPNTWFYVPTMTLEPVATCAITAVVAFAVTRAWDGDHPSRRDLVVLGLLLGISALVRPFLLPFVAVIAVVAWWTRRSEAAHWRAVLSTVGIVVGLVVAVDLPWIVRNEVQLHAFVPYSTNLGDTACMARFPGSDGGFHWAGHEWCAPPGLDDVTRNGRSLRLAASFVRHHPGEEIRLIGKRAVLIFEGDHDGLDEMQRNWRGEHLAPSTQRWVADAADAAWFAVLVLAVAGLALGPPGQRRWRWLRPEGVLFLGAGAVLTGIPLLLWGTPRFHQPLVPTLTVLAGLAIDRGAQVISRRRAAG